MEEMYFAWLENPQSVHKVGTHPARGVEGPLLGPEGSGEKQLASCVISGRFRFLPGSSSSLCESLVLW